MDQAQVQQIVQQALQQQEQRFRTVIDKLQSELDDIKTSVINGLLGKNHGTPKPKLPDVDKFDGTLQMWEVWYPEIKAKLRIDGAALGGSDEAKFWYIYSRLVIKVQSLVAPQLKAAERDQSFLPQNLFDQLARLCDNPNSKREAQDKLHALKQFPDQSFNSYLATFERQMYKAEADTWDDGAKISLIRRQLNDKLKKRLRSQIMVPTTYHDFVKVLQQLDDSSVISSTAYSRAPPKQNDDAMQISNLTARELGGDTSSESEVEVVQVNNKGYKLYNAETGGFDDY